MASAVDTHRASGGGETAAADAHHAASAAPGLAARCPPRLDVGRDHDHDYDHDRDDEEAEARMADSSTLSPSSVTSPPYWVNAGAQTHQRSASSLSADSVLPAGAITLRDNDTAEHDDRNAACWAKSVEIVDYTTVNGGATSFGAFVVWTVRVETLSGSYMNIRKRYSEFDELRRQLIQSFPDFEAAVPPLPPKSVISKFRPRFLDKRRAGLQYFLNCIMLNPEFSGSPVLKEFLFR